LRLIKLKRPGKNGEGSRKFSLLIYYRNMDLHRIASRIAANVKEINVKLLGRDAVDWYMQNKSSLSLPWIIDVKGSPKGEDVLVLTIDSDKAPQDPVNSVLDLVEAGIFGPQGAEIYEFPESLD